MAKRLGSEIHRNEPTDSYADFDSREPVSHEQYLQPFSVQLPKRRCVTLSNVEPLPVNGTSGAATVVRIRKEMIEKRRK